ncbi:MAG: 23S rRNA (pseudouridine(1915)-N(3))-methyltransferase RlmH [Hyphomicrobiales bacterium]|nr:23S rRNA (pseudouridine(1915)-N(3))-methyltransferase RlmH [Hyphomicrobiales bacterium]
MRLTVAAVGKLKAGPERALVERYQTRATQLAPGLGFSGPDLRECAEGRERTVAVRKTGEAQSLARLVPDRALVVCLDERGESQNSADFARKLAQWRDAGNVGVAFVIGGADGLDPAFLARASLRLGFGAMTLPHQLVRVLVLEQIYRAMTHLAGHPYHRA